MEEGSDVLKLLHEWLSLGITPVALWALVATFSYFLFYDDAEIQLIVLMLALFWLSVYMFIRIVLFYSIRMVQDLYKTSNNSEELKWKRTTL